MKLKRMVACILTLLLVVSLLPIGALAEETINDRDNVKLDKNYDTNNGKTVVVPENITVGINKGHVVENYGTVVTNSKDVEYNLGAVQTNNGSVSNNEGTVGTNNGNVSENGGTIETNNKEVDINDKIITTNNGNGSVSTNFDTVKTNDGTVKLNYGTVETNNGTVGQKKDNGEIVALKGNRGNIDTNNGTVLGNWEKATIGTNNGKVENNYGTVDTNGIDGVVYNYNNGGAAELSNDDAIETPTEQPPAVAGIGTNFGTVHNKVDGNTYYGLSWGESVDKLNSIESFVAAGDTRNLDEIAKGIDRKGFKMKSYTAYAREEGKDVVIDDTAGYEMNAPTWLEILWQKLGGKSQPKPTRTPVYTNLSGDQVKGGAFLRVGDCIFKIIEVNEDNIRVATVKQLPEKALTDMLGFLKQYLSDAQIAKFQGEPELLEEELVAKFFGGSNEHIAFYASRDLFA